MIAGLTACGPRPHTNAAYVVVSQGTDPSTGTLMISIKLPSNAPQNAVRSAAESVIADNKQKFGTISVRSYLEDTPLDGPPHCISSYRNGEINHSFRGGAEQKIPTH